jgi:phosphoglycerol transferase MdoB-like AlkP superfamily enzyme
LRRVANAVRSELSRSSAATETEGDVQKILTARAVIYFKFLFSVWAILICFRLIFLALLTDLAALDAGLIAKAFYIGVRFDGRIAALSSIPLAIFLFAPYLAARFDAARKWLVGLYGVLFFLLLVIYEGDVGHYFYLGFRVNYEGLALLADPKEAISMAWDSYPVVLIAFCSLLFTAAAVWFFNAIFKLKARAERRSARVISGVLSFAAFAILCYGQYAIVYFPLRWSEAYFNPSKELRALALNPIQNLYDTALVRGGRTYDLNAVKEAYPTIARYLGFAPAENMSYARKTSQMGGGGNSPNVVLIVVESLSTHKTSLAFDELPTTPFIKELASKSLYFPNYYSATRTTARATFTILTGIADANPRHGASRDPAASDQETILNGFDGYEKIYMLSGSANWANIRATLTNNVKDIKILEEGYWRSPRIDAWGISDLDLFIEANEYLSAQSEPFIAIVQTSANHRPFTIPKNVAGYDYELPSEAFMQSYGFDDGEYQAMRFCDFAIRRFFELAEKSPYFDNTIFVVTGDHGIMEQSPKAGANYQKVLQLQQYHVPLIVYYPKVFDRPKVLPQAGSHVDLMATIASLVGIEYENTTLGRDLLDERFGEDRYSVVVSTSNDPVAVSSSRAVIGGRVYVKEPFVINEDWIDAIEEDAQLDYFARAYKETARYMLYNNKKRATSD